MIKLDHDHRQQRQPSPPAIQSRVNSADGDLPRSPDSSRDRDGDGGNCEVSCLVAGLYTRCSAVDSAGGRARSRGAPDHIVLYNALRFPDRPGLFTREALPLSLSNG